MHGRLEKTSQLGWKHDENTWQESRAGARQSDVSLSLSFVRRFSVCIFSMNQYEYVFSVQHGFDRRSQLEDDILKKYTRLMLDKIDARQYTDFFLVRTMFIKY